jgi:hypothetical protein
MSVASHQDPMAHLVSLLFLTSDAAASSWHTSPAWGLDFHVPDGVVEVRDRSADEVDPALQLWLRPPGARSRGVVEWKIAPGVTLASGTQATERCGKDRFKKSKPSVRETRSAGGLRTVWVEGTGTTFDGEHEAFVCVTVETPSGLVWSDVIEAPDAYETHRATIERALLGVRVTEVRRTFVVDAAPPDRGRCPTEATACVPEADAWIRNRYPLLTSDASPAGMKARWRSIAGWSGVMSDATLQAHGHPTWGQTMAMYSRACDEGIALGCTSVGMAWQALAMDPDADDTTHVEQQAAASFSKACALKDDHGCLQVLLQGAPPDYAGPSIAVLCGRGWEDACNYGR